MKRPRGQMLLLAAISGVNALLGIAYSWLIVARLGMGLQTDALFAGMVLPQLILVVTTGSLTSILVPLFTTAPNEDTFRRDAWTLSLLTLITFGALAVLLAAVAPLTIPLTVPGFNAEKTRLTIALARIQLVGLPFSGLLAVLQAATYSRRRFLWGEITILASALIGFVFLLVGLGRMGIAAAAIALTLRPTLQALFLLPGLGRFRAPNWKSETLRAAWLRSRPLLLGNSYYKLDILLDRVLSSMAPSGSLSLLYLGQSLYATGNDVANRALINPMLPQLALHADAADDDAFRRVYRSGILRVLKVVGASYLCLVLFGEWLLSLVIGHGGVTHENVHQLWLLMALSGGVLVIAPLGSLMTNACYARGTTDTPTVAGVIAFTIGAPLKLVLFYFAGVEGLALGISLYFLISLVVMTVAIRRRFVHARFV